MTMDVSTFKWCSLFGLLGITIVASLVPLKLGKDNPERAERVLAYFSFVTGGVFLGAGLLHMMPDAIKDQQKADLFQDFPVALLTACMGFISIWGMEKINFGADIESAPLDRQRMVAVTAGAWNKSANICYVTVAPTTTYGSLEKTLQISSVPTRSVSSPALSSLSSPALGSRSLNPMTPLNKARMVSPIIIPTSELPPALQETFSPRQSPASPAGRTPASGGYSSGGNGHAHSSRARSSSNIGSAGTQTSDSDNDMASGSARVLSSYQQESGQFAAAPTARPHQPKLLNSPNIMETLHEHNSHSDSQMSPSTSTSHSADDKSTPSTPTSGSKHLSLRQQAQANLQQKKIASADKGSNHDRQQNGGSHSDANGEKRRSQPCRNPDCSSPNTNLHEHVCYDFAQAHGSKIEKKSKRSSDKSRKPYKVKNQYIDIPNDGEEDDVSSKKKAHSHSHNNNRHSDDSDISEDEHDLHDHRHDGAHHHHIVIPSNLFLPIALTAVFSFHSVVEGTALGIQNSVGGGALSILIAITSHKAIEAITVSSNFVKEKVALRTAIPIVGIYCCMTPLGILIGLLADDFVGSEHTVAVTSEMSAFAAGSFVYLAIHEISEEKCCKYVAGKWQVLLMLLGLGFMAALAVWI